jgi:predicted Zn-dependent protease
MVQYKLPRLRFFWLTAGLVVVLCGCGARRPPVPVGDVPAVQAVSADDERYGQSVLAELVERYELDRDDANIERVRLITDRLTEAANAGSEPWHVYVLKDDNFKNAAATRGNYIFVWTGMLRTVSGDDELATVLAHEIGHVLAGHTARDPNDEVNRMIAGVAGAVTGQAVGAYGYGPVADIANILVKAAIEAIIVNPVSQEREFEADHIGLFLMADAGYDPTAGVEFWRRAQFDDSLSSGLLEFLSTHPSTDERFAKLSVYLPDAADRYERAKRGEPSSPAPGKADDAAPPRAPGVKEPSSGTVIADSSPGAPIEIDWVVDAPIIPVYAAPDTSSEVIAELAGGARLRGTAVGERWVEVAGATPGFVEKVDLAVR